MNIFAKFLNTFKYTPKEDYNFIISENEILEKNITYEEENAQTNSPKNIFSDLNKNLEYINIKFNTLINSDIIIRKFNIYIRDKQYKAFILYIDGMTDSKIVNDFVLKPLMLRNKSNTFDNNKIVYNNVTIRKVQKVNLVDYIYNCLIPQNNIEKRMLN